MARDPFSDYSFPSRPGRFNLIYLLIAIWITLFAFDYFQYRKEMETIPYSEFVDLVDKQNVSEVTLNQERVEGKYKVPPKGHTPYFSSIRVDDPDLVKRLSQAKIKFSAVKETHFFRDLMGWLIPAFIFIGIWMFFLNRFGQITKGGGMLPMGKSKARIYVEKDLPTRFEDVAGVEEAKSELKEVVDFLKNPKSYSKLGGRMPKGILLVGPPGTGKTLLARAIAGEANVPFFSINGSEFVELFVGLGAARVRDLFQQARSQAPCIVFIDELDALGKARGLTAITGASNDEKEQTLNQLLAELDGFDSTSGVILLAATNRPEVLDPALLRAGRFDRQIGIDKPDRLGRKQILDVHLKKIKVSPNMNSEVLAGLTAGFSGADLGNLVNEAALFATRRGADYVEEKDFNEAIERIVAGLERKSKVLHPDEKRRVAFHEMGHATVALALGAGEEVHKVSIIPRGFGALGYTMRRPTEDRYLMGKKELEKKLAIALGGRAAESIFFDDISTGAADDLDKATEIARAMITRYGMSSELGLAIFEKDPTPFLANQALTRAYSYSEKTAEAIDSEIRRILDRSITLALHTIRKFQSFMTEGSTILLEKETLDQTELKKVWDKYQNIRQATVLDLNPRK